jgi:hypothetical protein|tara:strand:- start:65963 stop:66241 length:279 start_codon:yes stop_codon:yes gene_type:complete
MESANISGWVGSGAEVFRPNRVPFMFPVSFVETTPDANLLFDICALTPVTVVFSVTGMANVIFPFFPSFFADFRREPGTTHLDLAVTNAVER